MSPYTMQYETIIDVNIISSIERVVNVDYLKKLRYGSKWFTQTDGTDFVIPLHIIFHTRLKVFVPDCVDDFQVNKLAQSQHSPFL